MAKPSGNMTEDDLLSALGIAPEESTPRKSEPPVLDSDLLVDVFVGGGGSSKKSSKRASSPARRQTNNSAEREAQLKEKSIRANEWKRELEEQQGRSSVFSARSYSSDTSKSQDVVHVKAQPIIPNTSDMEDIEEVASMANEKLKAQEQIEHRRQAMQEQIRQQQAEVARQAQLAEEQAKRRQQAQQAAKRAQASQQTKSERRQQVQAQSQPQPKVASRPERVSPDRGTPSAPIRNSQSVARGNSRPIESRPKPVSKPSQPAQPQPQPQQVAPAPAPEKKPRRQKRAERAQQRPVDMDPASKESPLGVVLIVLAVLCVLVAASLLTGLWDISNL